MHGYSSSEEDSDDEYLRRKAKTLPPSTSTSSDSKKKKKRKYPPQESINRIWKKFSKKKFSRALSVLPFEPVPPPAETSNELLSEGYERAAEECRRKVKKIIEECRRVNTRYRDPGWDLDWDLKWEKGYCLNSLRRSKFDLSDANLRNPKASVPKAVKRVHEIFEKPTFMAKLDPGDIKQGSLGDCWLIASMSGLANVEEGLKRICVAHDTRIGIYGFVFYRDGEWIYSIIDDKLYLTSPCWDSPSLQRDLFQQIDRDRHDAELVYRKTYQTGSKALFFGANKDQNETWVPLLEKAYAKAHGDFASLHGGWIGEGLEDLSGGVTTELLTSDILDLDAFWDNELSRVNEEFLFGCSTGLLDGGYGDRNGITERHAYIVMEARTLKNGTRLVKLRNPWGKLRRGVWEGAWSDGSKEWTQDVQDELNHQFGNDSVFWISYEDMLNKYLHFDRTRLFRDPDWRCCQRWISVDVPWKPQFNEKFHFQLAQESPLVLVLTQLDDRYFQGLEGQYTFRLHFRLHRVDEPNAEDYIVRSHGNYLMDRSVSIELPAMLPGKYSVFILVEAERWVGRTSIEEVVKRECKRRVHNDKFVQVGAAYDLAHSKAVVHFEAVQAARRNKEQKLAARAREDERLQAWEKRHLQREVTKKQARKNNAKIKAKLAAKVEAMKKEEEEKAAKEKKEAEEKAAKEKKEAEEKEAKEKKEAEEKAGKEEKSDSKDDKSDGKDETSGEKSDENSQEKPDDKSDKASDEKTDEKSDEQSDGKSDEKKPEDEKNESKEASTKDQDEQSTESKTTDGADGDDKASNASDDSDDTPVPTPLGTPNVERAEPLPEPVPQPAPQSVSESIPEPPPEDSTKSSQEESKTEDKKSAEESSQETAKKSEELPAAEAQDGTANSDTSSSDSTPKLTPQNTGSEASVEGEKPPTDDKSETAKVEDDKAEPAKPGDVNPETGKTEDSKPESTKVEQDKTSTNEKTEESKAEQDKTPAQEKSEEAKAEPEKTATNEKPDEAKTEKDKPSTSEKPEEAKAEQKDDKKPGDPGDKNEDKTLENIAKEAKDTTPKDTNPDAGKKAEESKADAEKDKEKDKDKDKEPSSPTSPSSKKLKKPKMYLTSEGESSASPVSDYEDLYSSDDLSHHLRANGVAPYATAYAAKYEVSEDEEGAVDAWNAVCVVGFRVYSKDKDLELRVVMEGGDLDEGGMGEKGQPDLDNAQANAGGARKDVKIKEDEETKAKKESEYEGDSEEGKRRRKGKGRSRVRSRARKGDLTDVETDKEKGYPVIVQKVVVDGESEYEDAMGFMTAEEK